MALNAARGTDRVILLGRSEPFAYEAGEFRGRPYPAGRSLSVCVGHDDVGFSVLKVKGKDFDRLWPILQPLGRGVELEIDYTDPRMQGQQRELVDVRVLAHAGK